MDFQITNSGKIFFHSLKPQGTIGEIKNPNELGLLSNVDLNYGVVCGNFCIAPNASILKKPLMTYQALISTDTIICLGSSIVPLLPECFDSLVWDGEMLNMEILEPEEAGDYVFRVYQNQSVYTDTISIQIFNDEIVNIDTSICESERFTIDGTDINQSGIYFDSLVSIFGCDSVIRYEVNIRSCPSTLSEAIYTPTIFSPNGDGINDEWGVFVNPNSEYQFLSIHVFNRWGNLVFNSSDSNERWDGKLNGQLSISGTYVFVVRLLSSDNKELTYFGDVTSIN